MNIADFINNAYIVIYILLWLIVVWSLKRRNISGVSRYIASLYLIWAILSLFLYNNDLRDSYNTLSLLAFLYLFFMIYMAMSPCVNYDRSNVTRIQKPSEIILYSFFIVYGVCSLITLPTIVNQLTSNFQIILNDAAAGETLYNMNMSNNVNQGGVSALMSYAALIRNFFREIFIFFLFYYLSLKERLRSLTIYLIVILALDIVSALARGGRTSFTMMLFAVGASYYIFYRYWNVKVRRIVSIFAVAGIGFLVFLLVFLTISRFSYNNYSRSPVWSFLSYLGQAPLNFSQSALDAGGIRYGDRTINELKRLMGLNPPLDSFAVRSKYSYLKISDAYFSTFIGDFVLDFGPIIASIIFLVFSFIARKLSKTQSDSISFHQLLIVYFAACVCSQGSMYLFFYSFVQFWTIIAFVLMTMLLFMDYTTQNNGHRYITIDPSNSEGNMRHRKIRFRIGR